MISMGMTIEMNKQLGNETLNDIWFRLFTMYLTCVGVNRWCEVDGLEHEIMYNVKGMV